MRNYLLITIFLFIAACGNKQEAEKENIFYTCSMHPQIMVKQNGTCPICGMKLIQVQKNNAEHKHGIQLSKEQILLANIQTKIVATEKINNELTLTGTVVENQNKKFTISSRVSGRIEKLYIKNTGENIQHGQLLYELYSEELISAQKEYLVALQKLKTLKGSDENYRQFIEGIKNKLLLWGLTEKQLSAIETTKEVKNTISIYASLNVKTATVNNILVKEGEYVMEGATVFELTDLSSLWVEAQLYPQETAFLHDNHEAEIIVAVFPDKKINSKIFFVNPELQASSKIILVRAEIENKEYFYKPGMLAYFTLSVNQKNALVVPVDAVLRDAEGTSVWIQMDSTYFEKRKVILGIENKKFIEIKSGLKIGEKVVISGAYLLNSEHVFKSEAHSL